MMKFSDYLNQYKRKFVCLNFDKDTVKSLRDYCRENGFDLTTRYDGTKQNVEDYEFHTTVFYTDTYHNMENTSVSLSPFEVSVETLELFGPNKNIPVLKLKLNEMILDLRSLFEQQGLKDSWPEYKPHISLSYKFDGDIAGIPLPSFPLIVNSFKIKDGKS